MCGLEEDEGAAHEGGDVGACARANTQLGLGLPAPQ
jgi:hypothetical protein